MIRTTYLELNFLKNFFWKLTIHYYNNKGTRKVKSNSQIKKFTSPFNLTVLNTKNPSNAFHGQTSSKDIIFSFLKSGVKLLVIVLRNDLMDKYLLSGIKFPIHFSLHLNHTVITISMTSTHITDWDRPKNLLKKSWKAQ